MSTLLTGQSGFIGSALKKRLPEADNWETHSVSRYDQCIHCAAFVNPSESQRTPSLDVDSILALTDLLESYNIHRLIFLSSGAVYDGISGPVSPRTACSPLLPYAVCKLAAEQLVKHAWHQGVIDEYIIIRLFGAYGPSEADHKLPTRLLQAHGGLSLSGNGENLVDYLYIDDCADAIIEIAESDLANLTLDLAGWSPLKVRDFATQVRPNVKLDFSGAASEPIRFYSICQRYRDCFGDPVKTSLSAGLRHLQESLDANRD